MPIKRASSVSVLVAVLVTGIACSAFGGKKPLRVYVLAGQSNMQGHGVVDLDHEEHYNGGKGTLVQLMENPRQRKKFAHLRDKEGNWTQRDDVYIRYQTKDELKRGPLSIGFTGYPGQHHLGPELQFGHVMGDAFE